MGEDWGSGEVSGKPGTKVESFYRGVGVTRKEEQPCLPRCTSVPCMSLGEGVGGKARAGVKVLQWGSFSLM